MLFFKQNKTKQNFALWDQCGYLPPMMPLLIAISHNCSDGIATATWEIPPCHTAWEEPHLVVLGRLIRKGESTSVAAVANDLLICGL